MQGVQVYDHLQLDIANYYMKLLICKRLQRLCAVAVLLGCSAGFYSNTASAATSVRLMDFVAGWTNLPITTWSEADSAALQGVSSVPAGGAAHNATTGAVPSASAPLSLSATNSTTVTPANGNATAVVPVMGPVATNATAPRVAPAVPAGVGGGTGAPASSGGQMGASPEAPNGSSAGQAAAGASSSQAIEGQNEAIPGATAKTAPTDTVTPPRKTTTGLQRVVPRTGTWEFSPSK